jgi:hypothetical protein
LRRSGGAVGHERARSSCGSRPGDTLTAATLGPLADNGGPTETRLPAPDSSAIDRAGRCDGTDQRGVARPVGGLCDAGAVEAGALPPAFNAVLDRKKPSITSLKASAHRGRIAALRDLKLRFKLSEPARVRATFRGHGVSASLTAGAHSLRAGTLLRRTHKPGRYTLQLTATDAAGNRSSPRRIGIRVV